MNIIEEQIKEFDKEFPEFKEYLKDENDGYNGEIEDFLKQALEKVKKECEKKKFNSKAFISHTTVCKCDECTP